MPIIIGILLCAGESKRMGKEKLTLSLGNRTVIEHVLEQYINSDLKEVIVVVGANKEKLLPYITKVKAQKIKIAINNNYSYGMLSSLQEGIKLTGKADGYLVGLGDMPLINTEIINEIILRYEKDKIIQPTYNDAKGKPVIFPYSLKEEILSTNPIGKNPRDILKKHPEMLKVVRLHRKEIVIDMDTIKDYNRIRNCIKEGE